MLINNRYEIVHKISSGGFSSAYKAFDKTTNEYVFLKEYESYERDRDDLKKRIYQTEYSVTANLNHPSINKYKYFFEENDKYYLVSTFLEGVLLSQYYQANPTKKDIIDIFIQILHGLDYLHKKGIIHRDIKPENILVSTNPLRAYILDFGSIFSKEQKATIGTFIGTTSYAAPEQFFSSYKSITPSTDLWAFGVTVYRFVKGEIPFDFMTVSPKILEDFEIELDNVDEPFFTIIKKCLVWEPEKRVKSANELIEILLSYNAYEIDLDKKKIGSYDINQKLDEIQELTKNLKKILVG
jgi:serine/threonine protein kinase